MKPQHSLQLHRLLRSPPPAVTVTVPPPATVIARLYHRVSPLVGRSARAFLLGSITCERRATPPALPLFSQPIITEARTVKTVSDHQPAETEEIKWSRPKAETQVTALSTA